MLGKHKQVGITYPFKIKALARSRSRTCQAVRPSLFVFAAAFVRGLFCGRSGAKRLCTLSTSYNIYCVLIMSSFEDYSGGEFKDCNTAIVL